MWAPALRTGTGWEEYLIFDFRGVARLNGVQVGQPADFNGVTLRYGEYVKVEVSNSLPFFTYVTQQGIPSAPDFVKFDKAVEARYAKLVIIPNQDNPDASPIGVNK